VTTAGRRTFVDTNILVYATDSISPFYSVAVVALQRVLALGAVLISPQIVNEYLSVAFRSSLSSGVPSPSMVLGNVQLFRQRFHLVEENDVVITELIDLLRRFPAAGRRVHDTNIVATMVAHGVSHLLTNNTGDFARFAGIITVEPLVASV
jgi:predicted nucleic acid-binding protein